MRPGPGTKGNLYNLCPSHSKFFSSNPISYKALGQLLNGSLDVPPARQSIVLMEHFVGRRVTPIGTSAGAKEKDYQSKLMFRREPPLDGRLTTHSHSRRLASFAGAPFLCAGRRPPSPLERLSESRLCPLLNNKAVDLCGWRRFVASRQFYYPSRERPIQADVSCCRRNVERAPDWA